MEKRKVYAVKLWRKLPRYMLKDIIYGVNILSEMITLNEILVIPTDNPEVVEELLTGTLFPLYYFDLGKNEGSKQLKASNHDLSTVTYVLTYKSEGNKPVLLSRFLATPEKIDTYRSDYSDIGRFKRLLEYKKLANELVFEKVQPLEEIIFERQKFYK